MNTERSNETETRTDSTRRTVLLGAGSALTGAIAGCLGGDDDGAGATEDSIDDDSTGDDSAAETEVTETDDSAGSDGETETTGTASEATATPTEESMGTVVQDVIGGIEILGWYSEANRDTFTVYMWLENRGDQPLDVDGYTWDVVPFDENGDELRVSAAGPILAEFDGSLEPGAIGKASYHVRVDDAEAVDGYEISLSCEGRMADGAYCPE